MATATAKFDNYRIFYYSSYPLDAYYDALIYCYNGSTLVGRIEFHKPAAAPATLMSRIVGGQPFVLYRIDRFPDVQQILLNEKPLYLFVNGDNGIGIVGTDELEPVGQEE